MRYEDASHTGAFAQGSEPDARNDADAIAAGAKGPATGNVITGEGTQTGPSGSDYGPGAHITSIAGAGGEDSSFAGGKLGVSGEFGRLSIDAEGNYSYAAKAGTPENSVDRFTYTLADSQGAADTATLTIEIGKTPAVIKANAQQVVPGPDGVVILPPGVELSDVHIVGRNLVIDLPDGSQMVIVDGAVFVPQLVLGGVEVPATNLAALLVGQEIAPAAGEGPPQSSGGNFDVPVPPLDPGIPLGDLIPPTEYDYTPPEVEEVFDLIDEEPEIFFQPDGQPAAVNAGDTVDEKGLPERNEGEPEGSGEEAAAGADGDPSEATGGTIIIDSPDGVDSLTITGDDGIPHEVFVGLEVHGAYGTLTITGQVGGNFTYTYVLDDNIDHSDGAPDQDDFSVTLTDNDGDTATATLTIDIIDDVPIARPDLDVVPAGEYGPVTGNVITDDESGDEGDADDGHDTVGADDAHLSDVTGFGESEATEGGWIVQGQYGVLTIDSDGHYSYVRNEGTPGGVTDVFDYDLTDGDGDVRSTTLTITIEDAHITVGENPDVLTDDDAVPAADGNAGGPGDDADADHLTGTLSGSGGDGPLTFDLQTTGAPDGFSYADGPDGSVLVQQVQNGVTVTVLTVTLNASTGAYEVTQNAPILHDPTNPGAGEGEEGNFENNASFTINYTVSDQDDDVGNGTLTINVDDDTPTTSEAELHGTVDEDGVDGGIAGGVNDVPGADTTADGNVSSLFNPGADQPLAFSLLTDTSNLPQGLTSGGVAVTYEVVGNTLTASAGDTPVFTFTLNAETGAYTFTLLEQLDHPQENGVEGADDTENVTDIEIALGSIIQATDADGDSVTAVGDGLTITVDDDTPTASNIEVNQSAEDANVTINITGSIAGGADGVDLADVVHSNLSGDGSLGYNPATGVFTYDPAPGEEGDVTFDYTIVDGDGDEVTKTVTIHLAPDSTPQIGTPENLVVDEDGFAFANDDAAPLQSDPSETDHGENLTDSGQVVVDYGNDVPANPLAAIELLDNPAYDGQLVDLDGNSVTFALNGSGQLVGSTVNGTVMIISIVSASAPVNGEVTYTYDVELLEPIQHADVGNTENSDLLSGIQFQVTDSDGDPATGSFNVTVWDDVPSASDIGVNQSGEDANVVVDIRPSIVEGADGVALGAVSVSDHNGSGLLTYDDNGTFTYDPAPGETGDVSFDYTIVDGDGDEVTKTITIHLAPDSTPEIGTPENLVVDEDGFAFANDDAAPLQSDPSETDHGENLTDSGNVVVDFGNDVPGAPLTDSIELLDSAAYDGQLVDLDGNPVTFSLNGSGQLVGVANGTQVMIISISGAVAGPGAGEVTYSYDVELLQPVQHADVGNTENSDLLSGIQFQVTDSDGDPATGSFNVTVWDDVPSASDIGVNQSGEDANVVIDIRPSIVEGADGVDLATGVTHGAHNGSGLLTYDDNGTFTYDPAPGEEGDVSFSYTIVDGDGDEVTKTITIHLGDDATPQVGTPQNLVVDEDGLAGANVDGAPLQSDPGETNSTENATASGTVVVSYGNDVPGAPLTDSIELLDSAAYDGQLVDLDGNPVTFSLNGSGQLVGVANGTQVMIISISGAVAGPGAGEVTYTYQAQLLQPVQHADVGNNENTDILSGIQFQVTDSDGDPATGSFNVTVVDDVPSIENVSAGDDVTVDETAGFPVSNSSGDPVIDYTPVYGADGQAAGSPTYGLSIVGGSPEPSGLFTTSGFAVTLVAIDGDTVQGQYNGSNVAFIVQMNADGTVTLTQNVALNHGEDGGPAPTDHNDALDLDGLINATVTITDGDGDSATQSAPIGDNLVFLDDGPDAAVNLQAATPTLVLDETRPVGQETDGDSAPAGLATISAGFAGKFLAADHGSDGPGTVSYALDLAVEGANSGLFALDPADTESVIDGIGKGDQIKLFTNLDGSVSGRLTADGPAYFTISVDSAGQITFTQFTNVWHANTGSDDDTSTLTAVANTLQLVQTVTDGDGDFDTAGVDLSTGIFQIEDDGPQFTADPVDAVVENGDTTAVVNNLNLDIGTDGFGLLAFSPEHDGDPAQDQDGNSLMFNGEALHYEVNGNILTLETADGDVAATITLNQNGTYSFQLHGTISNGTETSFTDLTSSAAGNVDFRLVGEDNGANNAGNVDLILSGRSEDGTQGTINTDSDSIGVDSQAVNPGAAVRIDLVQDLEVAINPDDAGEVNGPQGFRHAGHVETTHFEQFIPQVQGSQSETVEIVVSAILADDDNVYDNTPGTPETGESLADIVTVTIVANEGGAPIVFNADGTSGRFSVTFNADGSATIGGLEQGDQYQIDTSTDFNAIVVESPDSNSNDFDLGVFSIGSEGAGTAITQDFNIIAQDRDGDQETSTISTTINPPAEGLAATSFSSLLASDSQMQKTAANSNSTLLAAAVAAAGFSATQAAAADHDASFSMQHDAGIDTSNFVSKLSSFAVDSGDEGRSMLSNENKVAANDDPQTLQSGQGTEDFSSSVQGLDNAPAHLPADLSAFFAAADHGPAVDAAAAGPVAPAVAMVSADALQAASIDGNAKHGGAVEKVLADALGHGGPPTVDGLLQALGNHGDGQVAAISHVASPAADAVPAWDMGTHGAFVPGADMMFKMGAEMLHHDAVQPVVNG